MQPRGGTVSVKRAIGKVIDDFRLSKAAKLERRKDSLGLPGSDPGIARVVESGVGWLCRAQDLSVSHDGGVSRDYSLVRGGWATSYPETTGYIIPTMLACARLFSDERLRDRARRMLDWCVEIQLDDGGFQGGRIDARPVVPVTFNTGQILLGLAAGQLEFGDYLEAMQRAADFLANSLDDDGCWRSHPTPFAAPGEKTYETHVSWGLFEAARIVSGRGYAEAGLKQVRWALAQQRDNGWMNLCCLTNPAAPLTHTIGYVQRGILEAYRYSSEQDFLSAAVRLADGLLGAVGDEGYLPGRLDSAWQPVADWVCLTGSAQNAHCYLLLYELTGDARYRDAGYALNRYVRRTVQVDGPPGVRGGVKGSFPVQGAYGQYEFLNWAVKFVIDANMLEERIRQGEESGQAPGSAG